MNKNIDTAKSKDEEVENFDYPVCELLAWSSGGGYGLEYGAGPRVAPSCSTARDPHPREMTEGSSFRAESMVHSIPVAAELVGHLSVSRPQGAGCSGACSPRSC
jgi:hypothetical protein